MNQNDNDKNYNFYTRENYTNYWNTLILAYFNYLYSMRNAKNTTLKL